MMLQSEHWVDLGAVRRVLLAENKIVGVACMVLALGCSRLVFISERVLTFKSSGEEIDPLKLQFRSSDGVCSFLSFGCTLAEGNHSTKLL